MSFSLDGWSIGRFDDVEWSPWGSSGNARAKVLANGDGYYAALVEAEPGYAGDPHEHAATEFLYVVDGTLRTQGEVLTQGDAYVAAAGSVARGLRRPRRRDLPVDLQALTPRSASITRAQATPSANVGTPSGTVPVAHGVAHDRGPGAHGHEVRVLAGRVEG